MADDWWKNDPVADQGASRITVGAPKPKKPEIRQVGNQLGIVDENTGQFTPTYTAQEKSGPKSATEIEIEAKRESERRRAATIQSITGEVRRLYEQDIKGRPASRAFGALEYIDSIPANDRFRAAGMNILPLIRPLVAQTAKEGDSDKEMEVFLSYVPSNDDSDAAIEQKFKMLDLLIGGMVDGVPPSQVLSGGKPTTRDDGTVVHDANLGGQQLAVSTNGYKTVDNPELQGVRGEYLRRLESGQSAGEIIPWLRSVGITDPKIMRSVLEQVRFRRANPQVPVSKYSTEAMDDMDVPLSAVEGAMNSAAQSAPGAYAMRAGSAVTANSLDSIVGMTGGNAERARIALDDAGRMHPGASLAGDLSGGVMATLTGEAGLARLGMGSGVGRALLADTGYGAAAGAGANDADRLSGAVTGGLAGLIGSGVGQGVTRAAGSVIGGPADASVRAVSDYAPLTIGQSVGRSGKLGQIIKGVEDRLSGLPVVGDMVNARRREGVQAFNTKAFDTALEPIGESVGNKFGEEAVAEANGLVQQAFQRALGGRIAQVDDQFAKQARAPLERIASIRRDGLGEEIVGQIEEATMGMFDEAGNISGEGMQALLGSLRQIRQAYKGDPLGHRIGQSVKQIERAVEGIFERQAPDVMPQYRAAKQAYRRLSVIADAVNRGKNSEGVFTPGQLGMADRANSVKFDGRMAAASGESPFHQFQRDAQNVLPNNVPDSGTAGRLLVPGAIAGAGLGGAGLGAATGDAQGGAQTGIGLATALSLLYSRRGQSILTKRGPKARNAGRRIKNQSRAAGLAGSQAAITAQE